MPLVRSPFETIFCNALPCLLAGWLALLPSAGHAQTATPAADPSSPPAIEGEDEDEEGDAETEGDEVDPKVKAEEEEARRLRIERQTTFTSTLPTEGSALLSSLTLPEGLVTNRGLRLGRFAVLPAAAFGASYTDNAAAADVNRDEDLSVSAAGTIRAQSLLARHQLGFDASANTSHSFQVENDDYFDWRVGADARLDLTRRSAVSGRVGYSLDTEDDSSAEAEGDATDIHTINSSGGYLLRRNRFDFLTSVGFDRTDFSGSDSGDRDQSTYRISQQITYYPTQRLSLFVTPQYAYSAFDDDVADDGEGRNAQTAVGLVGADFAFRSPFTLSGSVGYTRIFFEDSGRDDTDSLIANATLGWQIDPLTSLELSANHSLSLTDVDNAAARTDTVVQLSASRQIALNTALNGNVGTTYTDFEDVDRNDIDLTVRLGVARRLTDNFFLSGTYQYQQRFSDEDADYYENSVVLGLSVVY